MLDKNKEKLKRKKQRELWGTFIGFRPKKQEKKTAYKRKGRVDKDDRDSVEQGY